MRASINGEVYELPDGLTLAQLLERFQTPQRGIAVAKNDCVVRGSALSGEAIEDGDRIEIIKAAAGG